MTHQDTTNSPSTQQPIQSAGHYLEAELYELVKCDRSIFDFVEESSLDGLWYWDLEQPEHEWMSPKFWRTLGCKPADMPHRSDAWQDIIFSEDLKVATENFSKHLANPTHPYDQIVRYRHQDGSTVWIRCRGIAIRDEKGNPIRMLGAHTDLTSLKKKEEELKKTKELLEQTANVARVGGWEYDLLRNTMYWTQTTKEIHEVGPDFEPDLTTGINFYKEGHSQTLIQERVNRAIQTGESFDEELQIVTAKGNECWVRAIGRAEFNGDTCIRLYGTFQDIEQKIRAEEDLRILGRFFEHSGDVFMVVDRHYCIQRANPILFSLLNLTKEQLYGQGFLSIIHPDDQPVVMDLMKKSESDTEENSFHFEARINPEVIINWRTRYDAEKQVCYLVGRDVTKERNAQLEKQLTDKRLEESEKYLRLLAHNMTDLVGLHEPNGDYLYVSSSSERITGYSTEELIGKNPYSFIHPEDILNIRENSHEPLLAESNTQPVVKEVECRFQKKDGRYVWIHTSSKTVVENGKVIAITTSTRDITENKRLQIASEQYQQQLQRSNEELKNFAYMASHDLQEPLRMISSYLQLLESRYKDQLDQDANEFIWYAVDGAERMKRLINALLDYSRVERRFSQQENIDLNEVINVVTQNLSILLEEHQVTLQCNVLPTIQANDTLMIQLFQNLIGNSIKFRSENDVIISIDAKEKGNFWEFSVKDNGIGIEKKFHDRIFTIFKRLNSKIDGTGIGLAVVKKVIDLHHGSIWVDSTINQGATVFFKIPKISFHDEVKHYSQKEIGTPG
ncbi:MAG: PAS domain-containing protein [Cyclobacteriaceae bacterium]